MSLVSALRGLFVRAPKLRNRAGGMAWVKAFGQEYGADALAGHAVKTVRLRGADMWEVDPPQHYIATAPIHCVTNGNRCKAGDRVRVVAFLDDQLEPWKDDGVLYSEVSYLYTRPRSEERA